MADTTPQVTVSGGTLAGATHDGVNAFLGIPYAAPPLGERRFLPPEPAEPWRGLRAADRHGPSAPQGVPSPGRTLVDLSVDEENEDCLTLGVWTPDLSPAEPQPVMVWIHGGAFVAGGAPVPAYDGSRLAAKGVVAVSINYRLGLLGWLRCEQLGATGNQGLADQLAALEWVREEIRAFGGDPDNVTVFGESAGAGSIAALLSGNRDLPIRRAILQSGSHHLCRSTDAADEVCDRVCEAAAGDLHSLRTLPLSEIRRIQEEAAPRSAGVLFGPVTDGDLVALDPAAALADGAGSGVDVLVGTNVDEMGFFWARDERFDEVSDEHLEGMARRWTGRPGEVLAAYREARAQRVNGLDNRSVAMAMGSDWTFRVPAMKLAGWQSDHAPTWAYLFDWASPRFEGLAGSAHTLEVPFVMGTHSHPTVADFVGDGPEAAALSAEMMDVWVGFATRGQCDWPRYDTDRRPTRVFGSGGVENDPMGAELDAWG
ncbi:MAG: carboxylesterase/lipase family protein [Actinomycetia bacterium]|nr:carboxylesterase/lipase family protein [Actinomycetes bacterium]